MPSMIEKKIEIENFQETLKGTRFDLDYSIDAVVKLSKSDQTFDSIQQLMTDSLFFARQLNIKNSNKIGNANASSPDRKLSPNSHLIPKSSTFNAKSSQAASTGNSPTVQSTVSSNDLKNIN